MCEHEANCDSVSGHMGASKGQKPTDSSEDTGLRACPAPPFTTVALAEDATAVIRISMN